MIDEASALCALTAAAREFARFTPRRNLSGAYARALSELVDAARVFAQKSDEEWAKEVVALKELLRAIIDPHTGGCEHGHVDVPWERIRAALEDR